LRKYQKKLLWPFAILIIVTFGVTGVMTQVFSRMGQSNFITIFGEGYTQQHFMGLKEQLSAFVGVMAGFGRDMSYMGSDKDELVVNYLMYMREAQRLGIAVTTQERNDAIRSWFRDLLQYSRKQSEFDKAISKYDFYGEAYKQQAYRSYFLPAWKEYMALSEQEKDREAAAAELPVTNDAYVKFVENQLPVKRQQLERYFADMLVIEKLRRAAVSSAKFTTGEANALFRRAYQERKFEIAVFDPKNYTGKVEVSLADMEKHYDAHKDEYLKPETIDIEYVFADSTLLEKRIETASPASDADLDAFYKKERFEVPEWRDKHLSSAATKTLAFMKKMFLEPRFPDTGVVYKNFSEVKDKVKKRFYSDKAQKDSGAVIASAYGLAMEESSIRASRLQPQGAVSFETLEKAARDAGLIAGRIKSVGLEDDELLDVTGKIENFDNLFDLPLMTFSAPLVCGKGRVFCRVTGRAERAAADMFEVQDVVRRELEFEKAKERVLGDAKEAAAGYSGTFDRLALEKGVLIITTDFTPSYNRGGKLEGWIFDGGVMENSVDDKGKLTPYRRHLAQAILDNGFELDNAGAISGAFQAEDGRAFIIRLADTREPSMDEFRQHSAQVFKEMAMLKEQEFFTQWLGDLKKRADVTYPTGKKAVSDGPGPSTPDDW
jgi:hypothetical protein